ncbi:hypothetical protein CEUSTIGMA_g9309.t1 [Chlamydomonas eustigma]|uniref:Uncharacterized protein n=1 Tax=Chlamydomonas eustigma TaxID=1157962 RepID=A0A250XFN1_9CHLO|nr:hypothetical protein CEUSTIGMA_g9309.t1 [Chlamydomonas eustigma]|eukprot:GAX81881.1 hypothetical protein CEUSTIGMA_g9309.t1 [Chlamydomonas eustigma]
MLLNSRKAFSPNCTLAKPDVQLSTHAEHKLKAVYNTAHPNQGLQCYVEGMLKSRNALQNYDQGTPSRRAALILFSSCMAVVSSDDISGKALAVEGNELPKAYRTVSEKIIKSLRDSVAAENSGASENEVRRKADPAKENVREFMSKWKDNPKVSWHPSHDEFVSAITDLGQFYQKAGPRARMTEGIKEVLLAHMDAAAATLSSENTLNQGFKKEAMVGGSSSWTGSKKGSFTNGTGKLRDDEEDMMRGPCE